MAQTGDLFQHPIPLLLNGTLPRYLAGHMGWIADFFRIAWSFLYWNARKTIYRLRGTRGQCPCHHPSDSGRAGETACVAITHWNNPARFQHVCPLLQRTAAGTWRCSADRADVRPFWGRAAAFFGTIGLTAYLLATLAVFIFLRGGVGYQVTYPGVLWPPAWKKFTSIRTDFFLKKYQSEAATGDIRAALMSLSTAYNLDPSNYAAGRQLAQFWQVSQPGLSDRIYIRLLLDHPTEAEDTAQVWFRALLARGDFDGIEKLAAARITAAPDEASAWLSAFLFANERTRDAAPRHQLEASPKLPPAGRFLFSLSTDLEILKPPAARARLVRAASEAVDALSFYQVCRELNSRGFAQETLAAIESRPNMLGARDVIPLRLDTLSGLGWKGTLHSEVESLLLAEPNPLVVMVLSAHLIRHPDATVRERLFSRLDRNPLPDDQASYSAYLSLFCAAGVGGDRVRLRWASEHIKLIAQSEFRSLDTVGQNLLDPNANRHIENYLPALQPLPLEVTYALFEHYDAHAP